MHRFVRSPALRLPVLVALALVAVAPASGCGGSPGGTEARPAAGAGDAADTAGHTAPTRFTAESNAAVAKSLPLDDPQDFEDARRGLVATDSDFVIAGPAGSPPIWNTKDYA